MQEQNSSSPYAPETYDAMWTIALGLERVRDKFNYTLDSVSYVDKEFAGRLMESIKETSFPGISVRYYTSRHQNDNNKFTFLPLFP